MFQKQTGSEMDFFEGISLRVPCIFPCDVRKYRIPDLSGGSRSTVFEGSDQIILDYKSAVGWTYTAGTVSDWIAKFSFGFYSLMLTSTLIGMHPDELVLEDKYIENYLKNKDGKYRTNRTDIRICSVLYFYILI